MKSGSLLLASCSSVTPSRSISWSTSAGPAERSVSSGGRGPGIAAAAPTLAVAAPGSSGCSGVTGFGVALEVSGGASVAPLMSFSASFLPPLTSWPTSPLTWAALPEPLKSSASSRFLGAAASIAFCTAAMNALRSKVPGLLGAHLLDLRAGGLALEVVARRDGGGLRGRGARGRRLVGLGTAARGAGLALHGLEARVLRRVPARSRCGRGPPLRRRHRRRGGLAGSGGRRAGGAGGATTTGAV